MRKFLIVTMLISAISLPIGAASLTTPYKYTETIDYTATYVDARTIGAKSYENIDVPTAIWVNPNEVKDINDFLKNPAKNKKYIVFSSSYKDKDSIALAELMSREGFSNVYVLKNGWKLLQDPQLATTFEVKR